MSKNNRPEGFHSVTPYLVLDNPAETIRFMQQVMGATELMAPMRREDGSIMHAEMLVGNSPIMLGAASEAYKAKPAMMYVYVDDADAAYSRAMANGAVSLMEPADQPHGDRYGMVRDSQGNEWCLVHKIEELTEEEVRKRYAQ